MERPFDDDRTRSRRRSADGLEEGLDRLVSAGRQLVDGVSGARPGSRRRSGPSGAGAGLPRLGELGRWVEERLDGLLDADDEDWREPWQEPRQPMQRQPVSRQSVSPQPLSRQPLLRQPVARRPLEAISRRRPQPAEPAQTSPPAGGPGDDWPDDDLFNVPRWQRDPRSGSRPPLEQSPQQRFERRPSPPSGPSGGMGRPMPRSSRRRAD